MAALREILAHFGIEVDDKKLKAADTEIGQFVDKLKGAARVAAEAFAVYEVVQFAKATADAAQHMANQAVQLGVTADYVQALGFASEAAGQDTEFLVTSMGRLQYAAVEAGRSAAGPGAISFQKLGVHVKNANGQMKTADELFGEVADGLAKLKNPTERAAIATDLFGRAGRVLLPFLTRGSAGIKALQEDFERLGGGLSPDAIKKAQAFEKAWARIRLAINSLKSRIFEVIGPPLTWVIDHLATGAGWFARMVDDTNAVRDAFIALGLVLAPFALELAATFAPIVLAGAAIGGIYLLFDDLISLFEGKDTVIGRVMDKLGGKGTSTEFVKEMKEGWKQVKQTFLEMEPALEAIGAVIKQMVKDIATVVKYAWKVGDALGDLTFNAVQAVKSYQADAAKGYGEVPDIAGMIAEAQAKQRATLPGAAGGAQVAVQQTNQTQITVQGSADSQATATATKQAFDAHTDDKIREAHQVLARRVSQ